MLKIISWQTFVLIALLFTSVYYVIVLLLYFRKGLTLPGGFNKSTVPVLSNSSAIDQPGYDEFSEELEALLLQSSAESTSKETLIPSLKRLLQKYPVLKNMPGRTSILELIMQACQVHCSVHLSEADLSVLW
jgi:hypothetical protein